MAFLIKLILTLTLSVGLVVRSNEGARILLYPFAHCPNSHLLNMEKLVPILLQDGHDVTMLVPDTYTTPENDENFTQVKLKRFLAPNGVRSICGFDSLDDFLRVSLTEILKTFYRGTYTYCRQLLTQRDILDGIKRENYDVAIYDAVDQCSKLLADYIDIPFIVFHTSGMESILPRNPSFLPSMVTSFTDEMSLWQRTMNSLGYVVQNLIVQYTYNYYQELRKEQNLNASLSIYDSFNRAALRFILGEWGLDYVGPTQPSHILLGGVIYPQSKPLPSAIQTYIRNSDQGVVVLSFGSIAREFGPTFRELFAEALARLPYRVIWRYEEKPPVRLGNNTMLSPWIPQSQILEQKNVLAFVTHCGMNAAYEAARAGVPVVAIPLFADQFFQASKLINHVKMGEQLNIRKLTSDDLYQAIIRVANNAEYRHNAKAISKVMRDRPFSQQEQISRWLNYVVKHKGAKHLHCKGFDLAWYQYYLLDVALVLACIVVAAVLSICIILKLVFRYLKHRYIKVVAQKSNSASQTVTIPQSKVESQMKLLQTNEESIEPSPTKLHHPQ